MRSLCLTVASGMFAYGTIFSALGTIVVVITAVCGNLPSDVLVVIGLVVFAALVLPAFLLARRFHRDLRAYFLPPTDSLPTGGSH